MLKGGLAFFAPFRVARCVWRENQKGQPTGREEREPLREQKGRKVTYCLLNNECLISMSLRGDFCRSNLVFLYNLSADSCQKIASSLKNAPRNNCVESQGRIRHIESARADLNAS